MIFLRRQSSNLPFFSLIPLGMSLASTLHVSPKQIAECWEAHSLNKNLTELNDHSFPSFRTALIKDSDTVDPELAKQMGKGAVVSRLSLTKRDRTDEDDDGVALPSVTPPAKRSTVTFDKSVKQQQPLLEGSSHRRVSLSPAPPNSLQDSRTANLPKYGDRQSAGKVVASFNPNKLEAVDADMGTSRSARRCTVSSSFSTNVQEPYRHMFTTLEERAKALDEHLVTLGQDMVERYGLGVQDEANETGIAGLEAVGVPRQEKICCLGRICNAVSTSSCSVFDVHCRRISDLNFVVLYSPPTPHSQAHEGRINATSVMLEGSRDTSGGQRVELDLSHLRSSKTAYSLFPGQIVAVEGMNSSGRKMVAHRICEGAAHDPMKSSVKDLLRYHHDDEFQGGSPLAIMTACGPFTTSDNMEYEPMMDLVNVILADKPDVVILMGPFVDMNHKAVRSGQTTLQFQDGEESLVSFETFFANKIAGLLEDLFSSEDEELKTQFVLVPSLRDATAEWV